MKYLKFLFIFGIVFLVFCSSVNAEESPGASEIDSAAPSDLVEYIPEDSTIINYDFSELNYSLDALNESFNSSADFNFVREYVSGVLLNRSNLTDYIFFSSVVDGVRHYYLITDLLFDDVQNIVLGQYPCIDIYSIDGTFYQSSITYNLTELPNFAFGSFGNYSALIDKQFKFNYFYVGIICVFAFYVLSRKRVFS